MKSEKEIRETLELLERDEDLHVVILKDVGIADLKATKDVLKWVLD